jgi:sialate O-acetylesterase
MKRNLLIFISLFVSLMAVEAKVVLPQLFQSGMVLQRDKPIPLWGKADPQEKVVVRWQKRAYSVVADASGRWRVDLPKTKAGGPYTLQVGDELLTDVLVGDVWLCSGQSNVDVTIERVYPRYTDEIDHFDNDKVRLFRVQNETSTHGVKDDIRPTSINWKPLNKQNAWLFSALGSFLGKLKQEKSGVPQGIIVNSWGGTPIEAWISKDSLLRDYPMQVAKTELYDNPDFIAAQQKANQQASNRWSALLDEQDPGLQQHFTSLEYDDSSWETVDQYSMEWAKSNRRGIVGSIWLRQHVHIDKAHAGKPARLLLGTLFDHDITYLNGQKIGETHYQYPPRRYDIPEGLLREGDNVITVRFINKYGIVHFIKDKPYMLCFGDDRFSQNPMPKDVIPLSQQWKHHAGAVMPSCPSGDVNLQNMATTLYNAVVYPLAPYAISGVVWYQGESNSGNPEPYADLLGKLMGCWRSLWNEPTLPFCIVQLANYMTPEDQPAYKNWARLREQQRLAADRDPYAVAVDIFDLGEYNDIHPLRKKEVAERVSRCLDGIK